MVETDVIDHDPCDAKTTVDIFQHELRVGMDYTFNDRIDELREKYEGKIDTSETREEMYEDFVEIAEECFTTGASYEANLLLD